MPSESLRRLQKFADTFTWPTRYEHAASVITSAQQIMLGPAAAAAVATTDRLTVTCHDSDDTLTPASIARLAARYTGVKELTVITHAVAGADLTPFNGVTDVRITNATERPLSVRLCATGVRNIELNGRVFVESKHDLSQGSLTLGGQTMAQAGAGVSGGPIKRILFGADATGRDVQTAILKGTAQIGIDGAGDADTLKQMNGWVHMSRAKLLGEAKGGALACPLALQLGPSVGHSFCFFASRTFAAIDYRQMTELTFATSDVGVGGNVRMMELIETVLGWTAHRLVRLSIRATSPLPSQFVSRTVGALLARRVRADSKTDVVPRTTFHLRITHVASAKAAVDETVDLLSVFSRKAPADRKAHLAAVAAARSGSSTVAAYSGISEAVVGTPTEHHKALARAVLDDSPIATGTLDDVFLQPAKEVGTYVSTDGSAQGLRILTNAGKELSVEIDIKFTPTAVALPGHRPLRPAPPQPKQQPPPQQQQAFV